MDAGGADGAPAAAGGVPGATNALALFVPPQLKAPEKAVSIVSTKEIDELHGDEIARRLVAFGKQGPKGLYSKPRGK